MAQIIANVILGVLILLNLYFGFKNFQGKNYVHMTANLVAVAVVVCSFFL